MIDLDYDELNQAAVHLLGKVMGCIPQRFTAEEAKEFRSHAFNKLISFIRADVPCDIKTSIALFEQCLKTSELGSFPSIAQFQSVEHDVSTLVKKMDFTLFSNIGCGQVLKKDAFAWVQKEVLRSRQAVTDNQPYKNQKYSFAILSSDADAHNRNVFQEYFEKIKQSNTLYTATPIQLAQYVDPVITQVKELQNQLKGNWDLSSAIHKHRSSPTDDEDRTYISGYIFN